MVICIQSYFAVAVAFTRRFGVWSRSPVSTTSRPIAKRSTLSSGAPQAPARATQTPTSCSPGGKSLTHSSHLVPYRATTHVAQFRKKSPSVCNQNKLCVCGCACVYMCVWEGDTYHSLAFGRNHVPRKIPVLVIVSGPQPYTLTQMCMNV